MRPTWGWAGPVAPRLALHRVGFTEPACHQAAGALLPHLFTVTGDADGRGCVFLWHFPWGFPRWPLPSTLLCGVRTFLEPPRRPAAAWPAGPAYRRVRLHLYRLTPGVLPHREHQDGAHDERSRTSPSSPCDCRSRPPALPRRRQPPAAGAGRCPPAEMPPGGSDSRRAGSGSPGTLIVCAILMLAVGQKAGVSL